MKEERGLRGTYTLSLTSVLVGVGSQRHAPAALLPGIRFAIHCTEECVDLEAGAEGF